MNEEHITEMTSLDWQNLAIDLDNRAEEKEFKAKEYDEYYVKKEDNPLRMRSQQLRKWSDACRKMIPLVNE